MAKVIEERHFPTAELLVEALSPFNEAWGISKWIFRGQRDDSWKLVSSAMRPEALVYYAIGTSTAYGISSLKDQLRVEQEVVFDFVANCLDAGLSVPEDGQWIRNAKLQEHAFGKGVLAQIDQGIDVPFPLLRSLYALAQHHGAPTRLLDWSQRAFVAAYFACVDVAKSLATVRTPPKDTTGENVAVYALKRLAFEYVNPSAIPEGYERSIVEVEAPYAENPNLRAQRGTFTLVTYEAPRPQEDFFLPPLEDVLLEWSARKHRKADAEDEDFPFLYKFTAPLAQSRRLLRLLRQASVWAPTIRPNYDAVRAGIVERSYWT